MSKNLENPTGAGKSRSYLSFIIIIIIVTSVTFGVYALFKKPQPKSSGGVELSRAPSISSAPLTGEPSREYVKLQEQQNIAQTKKALEEKTAAISTPTRATYLKELGQLPSGQNQSGECSVSELNKARTAGVSASELACRGCSVEALKAAGYTSGELRNSGFTTEQLKEAGFLAEELKKAGFSAQELKDVGFSDQELKNAGFSNKELTTDNKKNCDPEYLRKAHDKGVSAAELKHCGAAALKAAGYTARELRDAGFSAGELRRAGFSAQELKDAGFSAKELKDAGFSAKELKDAGFSAQELKDGGFSEGDLIRAGLIQSSVNTTEPNCSYNALRQAHKNKVPAAQLKECGAAALRAAGYSAQELKDAGFSAKELKDAGFSVGELKEAGFTQGELVNAGINLQEIIPSNKSNIAKSDSLARLTTPGANPNAAEELARIREQQAEQLSKQERSDKVKELQQNMLAQSTDLFSSWVPLPRQQYMESAKDEIQQNEQAAIGMATGSKKSLGSASAPVNGEISKAGTIFYATLDTGINSDEPSPILATIVQGKYKGAKVLGKFNRVEKKVVLQFTTLNIPSLERSISINAYAIDPNTARTAMASDVDSHYVLRYGMLFASSFIEGLGDAIKDSGSSSITFADGSTSQMNKVLDSKEKFLAALGEVGTKFGDNTSDFINTPPTVKVDAGSTIGLLLMSDLIVPKK